MLSSNMNTAPIFPFSSIINCDVSLKPVQPNGPEDEAIGDDHKILPPLEILITAAAVFNGFGFTNDVEPILNDFLNSIAE
jgi:hypothetical protein